MQTLCGHLRIAFNERCQHFGAAHAVVAGLVLVITFAIASILGALFTRREEVEIGQQFSDLAAQVADKLDRDGRVAGVFGVHSSPAWASEIEQSVMLPLLRKRKAEAIIVAGDQTVIIGPKLLVGRACPSPRPGTRRAALLLPLEQLDRLDAPDRL